MAIYHQITQRSKAWYLARLGIPTASEFHRIVSPGGKISKQCQDYGYRLMAEMMLARCLEDYQSEYMIRGQDMEDSAIAAYEFEHGVDTLPGGFVTNDAATYGCSPDRLIGEDGVLEMKCPAPNTHIGYLVNPESMVCDKTPQIQGELLVTGRQYVALMSYHPELPPVVVKVDRDEKYLSILQTALDTFVAQLRLLREQLEAKYGKFPEIPAETPEVEDGLGVSDEDVTAIMKAAREQK